MKRYRVCSFDFDSRATILDTEMKDEWEDKVKLQHRKNIKQIESGIIEEFGVLNAKEKMDRFKEVGPKPFSIIAYHNLLLNQIRESYIQGAFYPALTSTCTLGERILNHLILDLRDEYKNESIKEENHPCKDCKEFNNLKEKGLIKTEFDIFTCKNCSNWNLMIDNLVKWNILNSDVEELFKKLAKKWHKSIHFNPNTIPNLKADSLEAIEIFQEIIKKLFPAFGSCFIPTKGEFFLKKELESKPFIKKYYLPNCKLVSPFHEVKTVIPHFIIEDIPSVEEKEVTDEEFIKLREEFKKNGILPKNVK